MFSVCVIMSGPDAGMVIHPHANSDVELAEAERIPGTGVATQCVVCEKYHDKEECPWCAAVEKKLTSK